MSINNNLNDNRDINNYQKRGFIKNLPFGVKATFIKYWFYGALYFFCFMGLGLTGMPNENLVLVTGLIGGVLFDIAVYNIFLLFAETREEASNWWFYKSKKFYSILINIAVITAMFFAFYFIIVPIKAAMGKGSPFWWLFQEPLSAALILICLDTAICWIKNLIIIWVKKIFKLDQKSIASKSSIINILEITPVSVTFEVNNKGNYNSSNPFNVLLDNQIIFKKVKTNVITIFDLKPDTQYKITINRENKTFITSKISKFYKVYEGYDIQKVIDNADQYSLIVVNKGTYNIQSLNLKSNIVIYFRKGAILKPSGDINDYPIIPSYHPLNKDEVYGIYNGEPSKMRQAIINIDHLNNVKIVGEGIIDGESLKSSNSANDIISPYLVFINHSKNIFITGITFNNSLQSSIHTFFSSDVNLLNLSINNSNEFNGISVECSSYINIIGAHVSRANDAIAIKSGKKDIADVYHTPSRNINIRNCFVESSNSGAAIGEEIASGVYDIDISNCLINNSNTGINIKTNMEQGKEAIVNNVNVNNISMNNVSTPLAMNMYHNFEVTNLINNKAIKNEIHTPHFENFIFKNIVAKEYELCAGCFYGLNEKYIGDIKIIDSSFAAKNDVKEACPINIKNQFKCRKNAFLVTNIKSFTLDKVEVTNCIGKKINAENANEVIDK